MSSCNSNKGPSPCEVADDDTDEDASSARSDDDEDDESNEESESSSEVDGLETPYSISMTPL